MDIAIINEPLAPVPHNVTMPEMATHSPGGWGGGTYPPLSVITMGKMLSLLCRLANTVLCEPGSSGVTTITYLSIDTGY